MSPADRTRRILREVLGVDAERLTDDADLINDLGADSLDAIELLIEAESEFGIEITEEDAAANSTVGEWIALVERKLP